MKNGVLAIITLGALLASVFGLSGCYEQEVPEPEWKVSGYFKYTEIEYEEDGATKEGICIVKLTDEGGEQERIYIPEEIDGKPVVKVGMQNTRDPYAGLVGYYAYRSEIKNTKKVFLPVNVKTVNLGAFERADYRVKVFSVNPEITLEDTNSRGNLPTFYGKGKNKLCTTLFKFNFINSHNDDWFFIDDYEVGERVIPPPVNPEREGYDFGGWYKEADCINAWDFENDTKGEDNLTLFAKWIKKII